MVIKKCPTCQYSDFRHEVCRYTGGDMWPDGCCYHKPKLRHAVNEGEKRPGSEKEALNDSKRLFAGHPQDGSGDKDAARTD